jgi:hypothetical protein
LRSNAAISIYQADTNYEIASLRSQRRLSRLVTNASRLKFVLIRFYPVILSKIENLLPLASVAAKGRVMDDEAEQ